MRAFRRFRQLSKSERSLLVRALAWLVLARAMLLVRPFHRVRDLPARASRNPRLTGHSASEIRWAVLAASRRLRTRCLPRALALQALLRQAGIASDLRIGVAKDSRGGLKAHAWVERDGEPFLRDEDLSPYIPLAPFR